MNLAKTTPPASSGVLARDRLLVRLAAWADRKLVIVHAQAGQGKSTLAADHLRSQRAPAVWYAFDAEDDDPAVFLSSFGEALRQRWPDRVPGTPLPSRHRYGDLGFERTVEQWTGRVFDGFTGPALIVLDDYSSTSGSPELGLILKTLFERTPPQVRFLLLSRTRPEIDVIALRARRSVAELTGRDLRFSAQEARDLFSTVFGTPVTAAESELINRTAEGWPAGLVLLHEYLTATPRGDRIARFSRGRGPEYRSGIFEYLAREVFAHLPDALQDFLLRTSVADSLTVPLMGSLSGLPADAPPDRPSVAALVRELRRRNLFISTDEDAAVVRYHALFRDFLRKQLPERLPPRHVLRLFDTAARHALRAGDITGAAELLVASGQYPLAVRTIERSIHDLLAQGRTRTVLRLVESLPPSLQDRPWFLFSRAVTCRFTEPRTALSLYEQVLSRFRSERNIAGQMLSLAGIIEACFHSGGDFRRMERAVVRAQALLRSGRRSSSQARARLLLALGTAWFFIGKLDRGLDALQRALKLFHAAGDHFFQISCAIYLAPCALYAGDFRLAREAVRAGFEAQQNLPDEPGGEAALHLVSAMTALFAGDFAEARRALEASHGLAGEHGLETIELLLLEIGGWLRIAEGDLRGAEALLQECLQRGEAGGKMFFSISAAHLLSIAFLFQRRLDQARQMSDYALSSRTQSASRLFHAIYLIVSGSVHLETGAHGRAKRELHAALSMLKAAGAAQQEANAHLMLARLFLKQRRPAEARRHLRQGFSIGRERGFRYYAPFTPQELRELAREAAAKGICRDHCISLLDQLSQSGSAQPVRIFCLGGFQVIRNGEPVRDAAWKSAPARKVVKLLAARLGAKVAREAVSESLWPDAPPERQGPHFRVLLHRTRKALDPGEGVEDAGSCILQTDGQLTLNPDRVWTDAGAFLRAVARARELRQVKDGRAALTAFEQAIALYGGDFLPADAHEDWATPVREQLRRTFLQALEEAALLCESTGNDEGSLAHYERLFSHDQSHDASCRWLMRRHASEGRRNEAVRVYERHELTLRRELDMEPEEGTKKLYRNIIGG